MFHLLLSPFGVGVLAGAGGLWLYRKYGAGKGSALAGKLANSSLGSQLGIRVEREEGEEAPAKAAAPRSRGKKKSEIETEL